MIKVGILGSSGYTANELVRILLGHKEVEIVWLGSQSQIDKPYHQSYQNFFQIFPLSCVNTSELESMCKQIDVLFCATPHNFCANILTPKILESTKVIDLSADFRLRDVEIFVAHYHTKHANPTLLAQSVYGLSELYRVQVKSARLVANPGCYPTCSILSLAPLLFHKLIALDSIIIDAKSGTSGAGRGATLDSLFCEVNENFKAYSITTHRHTPEIEQALSEIAKEPIALSFTPHLVPMSRGILATSYARLLVNIDSSELHQIYKDFYKDEYFVRVLDHGLSAQTRWVKGSNFIDIAPYIDTRTKSVIITACIDNLIKGASGQAVQNMNIMCGLRESSALECTPMFP